MTDSEWDEAAPSKLVQDCVTQVVLLIEPDADEKRIGGLCRFLQQQEYTIGEIKHAANELPKDEHLDAKMRYGKPLTPADFERVINRSRRVRAKLQTAMDHDTMMEMIEMEPELTEDDFGTRHDNDNNTVYLLKNEARKRLFGD